MILPEQLLSDLLFTGDKFGPWNCSIFTIRQR